MRRRLLVVVLGALMTLVLPAWVWADSGEVQEPVLRVHNTSPVPLIINGIKVDRSPTYVEVGSSVCVSRLIGYSSEGERYVFQGWSHGPREACVTLTEPGEYSVQSTHEVLLRVESQVRTYRQSFWVAQGSPTQLSVPQVVDGEAGVRLLAISTSGTD